MKKRNLQIVLKNISEACAELQCIEKEIKQAIENNQGYSEMTFEIMLRHAYHHLNIAFHVRNISIKEYRDMSDANFKKWGKFPKDFDSLENG